MSKQLLPLLLLCACCLLSAGCRENGLTCRSERRLNTEVVSAIPHTNGQRVIYDVSDGSSIEVSFRGGLRPPLDDFGCTEQFIMEFGGNNGTHVFSGVFDAYPDDNGAADIFINFDVNRARGNTLKIELFGAGEITAGRNATARVLAELTRNGSTYRNVLEQTYDNMLAEEVERIYYNIEVGLLGVETVGGLTFWRR